MKHFTITTHEQADALRPFRLSRAETPEVGDVVAPIAGIAAITSWTEYPEADALTFEQCMAIVKDELTEGTIEIDDFTHIDTMPPYWATLRIQEGHNEVNFGIPNPTATKIKLLTQILRGQ